MLEEFFPGRTTLYPQEVAKALGCSKRHVCDLVEEGKLEAINIAGANKTSARFLRIPVSAFRAYVQENSTKGGR